MVAALKSGLAQPVNVGLADWLSLAYRHYTVAVRNTRLVGREVAALIQWLEVRPGPPSLPLPSSPFSLDSELSWSPKHPRQENHSASSQEWEATAWRWDIGDPSDALLEPLFCRTVFLPPPPSTLFHAHSLGCAKGSKHTRAPPNPQK